MSLASYTGADNQLFLLNADGLQGFAGYCQDDNTGKVKAADIGGLFGEVVEVSTFADLKKYATADEPYTIVVTADLKVTSSRRTPPAGITARTAESMYTATKPSSAPTTPIPCITCSSAPPRKMA